MTMRPAKRAARKREPTDAERREAIADMFERAMYRVLLASVKMQARERKRLLAARRDLAEIEQAQAADLRRKQWLSRRNGPGIEAASRRRG